MGILKRIFSATAENNYAKGIRLYNRHKYSEAIVHFEKALGGQSACSSLQRNLARFYCAQAHRNLGIVRYAAGNFTSSLTEFQKALALNKEHVDLHYFMGVCFNNLQKYDEAAQAFNHLLKVDPDHMSTQLKLAITFHNLEMWEKAAAIYRNVLSKNPQYADVHYHLGLAHLGEGRPDLAEKAFQAALSINPDYLDARIKIGITQTYLGKFDAALDGLLSLSNKYPSYPDLHYYISIVHAGRNENLQAIDRLKQALKINPNYQDARIKLALLYCREAEFPAALKEIEEIGKIAPDDKNVAMAIRAMSAVIARAPTSTEDVLQELVPLVGGDKPLSQIIREFNKSVNITLNFSEMVSLIEKHADGGQENGLWEMLLPLTLDYIQQHPDYADLYNTLGSLCLKLNKLEEAIDAFEQAVAINPNYVKARTNLFNALKIQGSLNEALEHGRYLAEVNQVKYPDILLAISEIYISVGKYEAALGKAREVISFKPHYTPAVYLSAQIYEKLDRNQEAIEAYRTCLRDSRLHERASASLKRLEPQ